MTIPDFLDKVPWADMYVSSGMIRHRATRACPVVAVHGIPNLSNAYGYDIATRSLGLTPYDTTLILNAADDFGELHGSEPVLALRATMLERMQAAQHG